MICDRPSPDEAEDSELVLSLEDQRQQCAGHTEHGHDDRDDLERIRDGKGAVEDAEDSARSERFVLMNTW